MPKTIDVIEAWITLVLCHAIPIKLWSSPVIRQQWMSLRACTGMADSLVNAVVPEHVELAGLDIQSPVCLPCIQYNKF